MDKNTNIEKLKDTVLIFDDVNDYGKKSINLTSLSLCLIFIAVLNTWIEHCGPIRKIVSV